MASHSGMPVLNDDWAKAKLEKSPRHGEWVSIKYGNRTVQAYVVYPEVKEKAPVVVVIHEIFGLSNWARELTDELAGAGYIAIAPDLLSGFGPKGGGSSEFPDQDATVKAVSNLNADTVTSDLDATADYAEKLLGWRQVFFIRHASAGFERGVRLLRVRTGCCCSQVDSGSRLWFLCRQ
jgi:Dienelactone hydrolase family